MSNFVKIGVVDDFPEGQGRVVIAARKPVAVFKVDGRIHALNNICPHMGGPLGSGIVDEGCVTCPYHGMRFDLHTGHSVDDFDHAVQTYEVRIENLDVLIDASWVKQWR